MYLFHVEYHVRDADTDLVVHYDNTNNTAPNVLKMEACKVISLEDTERPVATIKAKREENGGLRSCPQTNF